MVTYRTSQFQKSIIDILETMFNSGYTDGILNNQLWELIRSRYPDREVRSLSASLSRSLRTLKKRKIIYFRKQSGSYHKRSRIKLIRKG